jgi:hypothetical protein
MAEEASPEEHRSIRKGLARIEVLQQFCASQMESFQVDHLECRKP